MSTAIQRKIILLLVIPALFLCGCSVPKRTDRLPTVGNIPPSARILEDSYWWRCRFKNAWPEGTSPDLVIDLLLAHGVVQPILIRHIEEIPYWRFHRRAARDQTGHQFSLLFYSTSEVADELFRQISQNDLLKNAIASGMVEEVITDNPEIPTETAIDATSDPHWSADLQKNWPAFIMGVSSLWLGLIDDSLQVSPEDINDPLILLEEYRQADARISEIWKQEGQHALLHHLNAIFGYKPLTIRKNLTF